MCIGNQKPFSPSCKWKLRQVNQLETHFFVGVINQASCSSASLLSWGWDTALVFTTCYMKSKAHNPQEAPKPRNILGSWVIARAFLYVAKG